MSQYALHPFVIAVYLVLSLYAANQRHFPPSVMLTPAAMCLVLASFAFVVCLRLTGDRHRSGLLVTFLYGHVAALAGTNRIALPLLLVLLGGTAYVCVWRQPDMSKLTLICNAMSLAMVLPPLLSIVSYRSAATNIVEVRSLLPESARASSVSGLPDIYHIVLDGYARSDVYAALYDFDNDLVAQLRERGFYVAPEARSNYSATALSLSSMLNAAYLPDFIDGIDEESDDRNPAIIRLKRNAVFQDLREAGYELHAVGTGYEGSDLRDADVFSTSVGFTGWGPFVIQDEFQTGLFDLTPFPVILRKFSGSATDARRSHILHAFDYLRSQCADEGVPVLHYVHIVAPHPPFLFTEAGEPVDEWSDWTGDGRIIMEGGMPVEEYVRRHVGYTKFLNRKLVVALDAIFARSPEKPIVIVHSDHGPGSRLDQFDSANTDPQERMSILFAIHLPDGDYGALYPRMSLVNAYRLVLNEVFGTQIPLLPDRSYLGTHDRPWKWLDVTDRLAPVVGDGRG